MEIILPKKLSFSSTRIVIVAVYDTPPMRPDSFAGRKKRVQLQYAEKQSIDGKGERDGVQSTLFPHATVTYTTVFALLSFSPLPSCPRTDPLWTLLLGWMQTRRAQTHFTRIFSPIFIRISKDPT